VTKRFWKALRRRVTHDQLFETVAVRRRAVRDE
jgi:hypothetical protein